MTIGQNPFKVCHQFRLTDRREIFKTKLFAYGFIEFFIKRTVFLRKTNQFF